jgi:ketosteroid isomerase-like protein
MSPDEDFALLHEVFAASARGGMREVLPLAAEDIEIIPFGAALHGKAYRGHAGLLDWWDNEIVPNWESFQVFADEMQRVGTRILVLGHWRACGRASRIELQMPAAWVMEVRDGKLSGWQTFSDRGEALKAIGLSE